MQKQCTHCSASFHVTDEDVALYEAVSPTIGGKKHLLPVPELCPQCRYQRRLSHRNERVFYRNTCKATGKSIVTIFSPDKPWPPVYSQEYWYSDKWDAKSYGQDIDFNRPFFEQWFELLQAVPQIALNNQRSENSEFTNQSERNKDCYMLTCSNLCERCIHSVWVQRSTDLLDCLYMEESELCYEVVNGKNCYQCYYSQNLDNCSNVYFSRNCTGCTDCFGCVNLVKKQYCLFNKQLTKEEYEQALEKQRITSRSGVTTVKGYMEQSLLAFPHKYFEGVSIENVTGDYVQNAKDSHSIYNCRHTENIRHCEDAWEARHCIDMTETLTTDFCCSIEGSADNNAALFCNKSSFTSDSLYCSHCQSCTNLFGCVGLHHAEYCILNKQYDKAEYEQLATKLIAHMQQTGEWGQHFPAELSPFGYNETIAQNYFLLTKDQALQHGWRWQDEMPFTTGKETVNWNDIPDDISDIEESLTEEVLACSACSKNYRIIPQEIMFYKKHSLPVPENCPDCRHQARMDCRNPRQLHERQCSKCSKDIQTTYAPERPEQVYCEECYLAEVY